MTIFRLMRRSMPGIGVRAGRHVLQVLIATVPTLAMAANAVVIETFDGPGVPANFGAQGGGSVSVSRDASQNYAGSAGSVRGSYPGTDGVPVWGSYDLSALNTRDIYVEFRAKMPSPTRHGLKFLKIFGKNIGDRDNYANVTFGLDYTGIDNGCMYAVSFGDGSTVGNDTANVILFDGGYPSWIGRSYGRASVSTPQNAFWSSSHWGADWHHFRFRAKFNSGTSAANEVADGAFYVEIDGRVYVDASGLFNRHYSNGDLERLELFGWSQAGSQPFEVWYDDLKISTGGFLGASPPSNNAPVVSAAAAAPSPVTGTTASLSVTASDDAGEAALIYTWSSTGPTVVSFAPNGTNAAKSSIATFSRAGAYVLTVSARDAGGLTATRTVNLTVSATPTTVAISPASVTVAAAATSGFSAVVSDQFGRALASQPSVSWTVSGGGTISATGVFTAGATAGGPHTVTATAGARSGTARVTVSSVANRAPVAAAQSVNVATDTDTAVTLSGSDADSDALTYAIVTTPAHGTLTGRGSSWTYTPATGYTGSDSFTFTVHDGQMGSAAATVSIQVAARGGSGSSGGSSGGTAGGGCGAGGMAGLLLAFACLMRLRARCLPTGRT